MKGLNTGAVPARKSLGQHFLLDINLTRKMVRAAGDLEGYTVFEIGPGTGGLTRALLESGARKIIAIEKDPRCVAALTGLADYAGERLEIIEGDALDMDLAELSPPPRAVVANLPYNSASSMLLGWLKNISVFKVMVLMFQTEVADRITAVPGTKVYGRLSVMSQFCCDVKRVMGVPARAFTPPPQVDSAAIRFTPRPGRPQDISFKAMETVTAAAFGQRRKMLRSSLKSLGGSALFEKSGIDPCRRAEELSVEEFEKLARVLQLNLPF